MPTPFIYRIGQTGTGLSQAEMDNNMRAVYDHMSGYGFSLKAICGMIGCFVEESSMNPGIYETGHGGDLSNLPYFPGGMGLGQWTDYPAYTAQYPNPLPWSAQREGRNWYDGEFQCWLCSMANDSSYTSMGYGQGPRWGWLTDSSWPSIAWNTFKTWNGSIYDAVTYWFYDFEWHWWEIPTWVDFNARTAWGQYAYELLSGLTPDPPGPWPGPPGPGPWPEPEPGPGPYFPGEYKWWLFLRNYKIKKGN